MPTATPPSPPSSATHRATWHVVWPVALWLATVGNLPLWQRVHALGDSLGQSWQLVAALGVPVFGLVAALLSLLAWPRVLRPAASVLVVAAALASHFMSQYGVVIDPTMLSNALHTDAREVRDLLSWHLLPALVFVAGPPLWWIWHRPLRPHRPWARLGRNALGVSGGIALLLGAGLLGYAQLASMARNHKPLRYMINPLNVVYAATRVASDQLPQQAQTLQPVGEDARLGPSYAAQARAPLLLLVIGETARAQNWGLNGYARPTTPALARWQQNAGLINYPQVTSCGTNTQVSVPCLFSPLTRADGGDRTPTQENLLDMLQRAGLAVLWLDNQAGCKGVCDRVPHDRPEDRPQPVAACGGGECHDEALLAGLEGSVIEELDVGLNDTGVAQVARLAQLIAATEAGYANLVRLVSRADALLYEFTVSDPATWVRPWRVVLPMTRSAEPIYEYACSDCGHAFEALVRSSTVPQCPSCQSTALEKQLSVFATASSGEAPQPMAAGPCGSCGHPDGPGSCGLQ